MSATTTERVDVATRVIDAILSLLERDLPPWRACWHTGGHAAGPVHIPLRSCAQPYRGINVLLLWASAIEHGWTNPLWITLRQANELGARVRKGEKSSLCVFFKEVEKEGSDGAKDSYRFMRGHAVFNASQVEGLPEHYYAERSLPFGPNTSGRIAACEELVKAAGPELVEHPQPHYHPKLDRIGLPAFESFESSEAYYAVLFHELVHWTGAPHRLARDQPGLGIAAIRKRDEYALEELTAELGAAFLYAELGLLPTRIEDMAAYCKHWLGHIRNDRGLFIKAAGQAQRARDHIVGAGRQAWEPLAEAA